MIAKSKKTSLIIKVDVLAEHTFSGIVVIDDNFYTAGNYSEKWRLDCFDIENEIENNTDIPKHYNNDNGTLYQVAQQRGWNAYIFDIVKRLERSEKKGEFESDLNKSKVVIDLWLKESKLC